MQLMNLHKGISFLQDENLKGQLQSIEKQLGDKTFNLPLIGQFSAGKSMLINNLLGAQVLPVKVTETTAFITYITYGETPKAMIRYKDEVQEEVSIDYIKSLHQMEVENEGHKLKQIRDIHVQYPSPFLEKGLCLIDTPGVNTLFAEHEALTKALLEDTYYMVYVMAKPLTQFDIQFIKSIIKTGVQPIFVRTGIDNIKSSEESVEQAVAKEKLMLQAQLNQEVYFYPITNKYQELGNMDFTMKFDMLRKFLQDEIIANRDKVKEEALTNKLAYLTSCIKEKLIQKQEQLKILNLSDEQTLTKAIEAIENQIYKLELESTVLERECTNQFTKAFDKLRNEIAALKGETIENFNSWLEMKICTTQLESINYEEQAMTQIAKFQEDIKTYTQSLIQETMKESDKVYTEAMAALNEQMVESLGKDFSIDVEYLGADELLEVENQKRIALQQELDEVEALIRQKDEFINSCYTEVVNFAELENEIVGEIAELNREIQELADEEIPQIYIEGDTTVSETLGTIGNLIDWALVFVPAKATVSAGKKAASILQKAGKVAKQGSKVEKAIKSTTKVLKSTKKMKKFHKTCKGIKQVATENENTGILKVLDLLSVEFYCKKVGQCFDTPASYQVDPEALADYEKRKQQLADKYQMATAKKLENLERSNLLKTQAEREAKAKALNEEHKIKLQQELVRLEQSFKQERAMKEKAFISREVMKQFKEMLQTIGNEFECTMSTKWEQFGQEYMSNRTAHITEQLENLHEDLQRSKAERTSMAQMQQEIAIVLQNIA